MAATLESLEQSVKLLSKTVGSSLTVQDTILAQIQDLNTKLDKVAELLEQRSGGAQNAVRG